MDFRGGEQRSPDYRAVNPKGRVPALVTPRGVLTETAAILDWIAATHPQAGLMPDDPWLAAKARETFLYLAATVHVAHAHGMRGARWADDPAAWASMKAKVPETMGECMALLEAQLAGDWVLGAAFSAADLYLWAITRWSDGDGVPLADHPRLADHHARTLARPAVARVAALHA